jgi:HEXXH motif-containing protein
MSVSAAGLRLDAVLDDVDPFNVPAGSDIRRVDAAAAVRWDAMLRQAWSLLAGHHRTSAAEISALVSVLVPLATAKDRQVSATSRDAFGAVALSEPFGATSLAEVHEVQHLKLGAFLDVVPLLSDDGAARWYAPWRDDPRPLSGLLQGAYAHLGVAGFWRRQRWLEPEPMPGHVQFARWRGQTWEVVQTLLISGGLTPEGHAFVRRMGTTLDRWRREPVPEEAIEQANASVIRHRRAWELRQARVQTTEGW